MKLFKVLSASILTLVSSTVLASHVPGGNITYECVGPNQYAITLTLYEDCGSAFEGNFDQTIYIANDCGIGGLTSASLQNVMYQQEVSQLCSSQISQSECSGGTLPGVWMHQWTGIVTLPGNCDNWTFSYSSCCRNNSNNLSTAGSDSYYWDATLYNQTAPCNNSAIITAQPIPYVCANQLASFNMAAFDPDGNTLVYSFVPAMTTGPGTSVGYAGGFSATSPIPGITIDPASGQIEFTPTVTGNYVVAVLIEEYDANGNIVGSIVQDYQFEVINCAANDVPAPPASGVSNFTGGGSATGPNSIEVCEGDSFCFDLVFTDADAGTILNVTSNITSIFPTATFNVSGTNPATATVCYTVQPGDPSLSTIAFSVTDGTCPIPGILNFPLSVTVISSTYAGPDQIMCLGVGAQLQGNGGTDFTWSVISGDPITGANFSCTNCQNPIANPSITTTYEVVSNLSGGCVNTDQITVTVVPDFTYNLTQSSATSCLLEPVQLDITTNPAGTYTYSWTPGTNLSSTSIANPVFNASAPGTYTYDVTISSADGCVKTDQITVVAAPFYTPDVTALASDVDVICGESAQLDVDLGGGVPSVCGLSASGGCAGTTTTTIGTTTGSNTSTGWPAPYGNYWANTRHQFLYTAAELNAMGFTGGKISAIRWQTTAQNGATASFLNYQISIKCTNATSVSTTFDGTGFSTVFGPQNINVVLGNNTHNFSTAYEWDGVSNLLVDVCYTWVGASVYTYNWTTPYTTTAFNSSVYFYSDGIVACGYATGTTSTFRPVTTFLTCPSVPDPADFTFAWSPAASLDDPTIQTPTATPGATTIYSVTVTNINGGCFDVSDITINVAGETPDVVGVNPSCAGMNNGNITATMPPGGPFTVNWYDNLGTLLQTTNNVMTTDVLNNLGLGTYTVETINGVGCIGDTTVSLTSISPITITASADATICINGSASISATVTNGTAPFTFTWDNGLVGNGPHTASPLTNTCYTVSAVDANGCASANSDQVCITINPALTLSVSNDTLVCPNSPITLNTSVSGGDGGPYNYVWTNGSGTTVGNASTFSISPATNDVFCVTVTDGCTTPMANDCINVQIAPVPNPSFIGDNLSGCYPVPVNFTNTTNPADVGTVLWTFGNGANSTQPLTTSQIYTTPGCYDVSLQVTSINGCVNSTTLNDYICVFDYPVANFEAGPQPTDLFHTEVMFFNTSANANTSEWDFAGLGSSTLTHPFFTFPNDSSENYIVTLIVTNTDGCTDTTEQTIIINGIFTLYIPSAFTPDGDNLNDFFTPLGEGIDAENYEFIVFNRWGEIVFQTTQLGIGWDGTENSIMSRSDVYVWKIKARSTFDNSRLEKTGHVTLIR